MAAEAKRTAETIEQATALNADAFKDGYERFARKLSTFADFQKDSLEALMTSAGVLAKGVEKAASSQTGFAKESFEEGVAAAKAAASTKSIQEALEIQGEYVRSAFEKNLGRATELADHWTAVAKEASDPLTKRYGEFVEMVQSYRP